MDFEDKRVIAAVILIAVIIIGLMAFLAYSFFFKQGYENELFSLAPSEGATGAGYAELTHEGLIELASALKLPGWDPSQSVDGAWIASVEYTGGTRAWSAYIKTSMTPDTAIASYAEAFGGVDTELLKVGGRELLVVYGKSDSERKNPVCLWKHREGIGVLALTGSQDSAFCRFSSDFSCRGQLFESSLIKLKMKSEKERIIVTEAACGGASLSSKNLRYVKMPDILVDPENEVWLDEVPCYDAGNNLAKGSSFFGKVFIKYYLESEGPGSQKLASGDVSATMGVASLAGARCIDILEKNYDPSVALTFLPGIKEPESLLPKQGERLGTARIANSLGKAIAASFGRQEADYLLMTGDSAMLDSISGVNGAGDLKCITLQGTQADLIPRDGKFACRRVAAGLFKGIAYERVFDSGSGVIAIAIPKQLSERAERTAAELAFGASFNGTDAFWVNETKGTVTVYFVNRTRIGENSSPVPLADAQIELYAILPEMGQAMGGLLETKVTDSSGKAILTHIPLSGGIVLAGKRGYAALDGRSKLVQATLMEDGNFLADLQLTPELSEAEITLDYLAISNVTSVLSGPIDARGSFPSLSAFGVQLVNGTGGFQFVIAVSRKAPAEEVALASRISETFASRGYSCGVNLQKDSYEAEPYKGLPRLLVLDSPRPEGLLIAVGDPETNAVLREAVGLGNEEKSAFVEEKGSIIAVVGSGKDAMNSAKEFVYGIKRTTPECGGNSYYGQKKLIDSSGKPLARVVIGSQASTEEAIAGAYIANELASMSFMCVKMEKEGVGCVPSAGNPEQLVFTEITAPKGYSVISIGGPSINSLTSRNCPKCGSLLEGQAALSLVSNDIYISGYRMNDTLFAGLEFASAIENPLPTFQRMPYYGIKVSGFTQKENGHHEVTISFYDAVSEIQNGKAMPGESYVMQEGALAKVLSVSAKSVGSASVTFDIGGKQEVVTMGRFLCFKGNIEDVLQYCTAERQNTTITVEGIPNPAVYMGKFNVFVDYTNGTDDVLGANCTYCIANGKASICRPLEYKWLREHRYADELILQDLPIGPYTLEANCSAEGYKNGTKRIGLNLTRVQLPDLVVSELWVNSIVNTKLTASARIKNIGSVPFLASDAIPLVVCLWDGNGRNLFSYINYSASLKPGESYDFTQKLSLQSVEVNNTLQARVDCNNVIAEERENNNEKSISFGRYG